MNAPWDKRVTPKPHYNAYSTHVDRLLYADNHPAVSSPEERATVLQQYKNDRPVIEATVAVLKLRGKYTV